ncbi:hypothetical protein [Xanthocytophaga agilis]|uniref:Uncharacterized protein n=1 Tax=Xanthocytophaga agilis TaxID=3048010 RepID=A0AAE3R341_9BACT|nr:hypothetical protein [Xanthocytophaga agilis]MDJ1500485.1 hypothetical protein [Xanthocytophaga agilis]
MSHRTDLQKAYAQLDMALMSKDRASTLLAILHLAAGQFEFNVYPDFMTEIQTAAKVFRIVPGQTPESGAFEIITEKARLISQAKTEGKIPAFIFELAIEYPFIRQWWNLYINSK